MGKIDHIGIAVNSLATSVPLYAAILGKNPGGREQVPSEGVEVAFFGGGPGRIELLEPTGPSSPVARFLDRHGPGIHHVCVAVPDLRAALSRLAERGVFPLPPGLRQGAEGRTVAFLHPRDTGGTLLELTEASETDA